MNKFRPKKKLGQAFLTFEPIADRLVDALNLTAEDEVLEIGAGKGILTERLIKRAKYVYAVEIDKRLVLMLKERLIGAKNIEIIHQDILQFDFTRFKQLKIIGNIPYSISSPLLFLLVKHRTIWRQAVLTLQKEFAARLLAQPGIKEYGAITVLLNLHLEARKLFSIPPGFFKPKPEIFSTALWLKVRERPLFQISNEEFFTSVVKASFNQRRKTLLNNLYASLGIDKIKLKKIGDKIGIDMTRRAETLTLAEFVLLAENLLL